ncbi:hypothetical protein ACC763_05170 [Rhizobium ruizarguesonis]
MLGTTTIMCSRCLHQLISNLETNLKLSPHIESGCVLNQIKDSEVSAIINDAEKIGLREVIRSAPAGDEASESLRIRKLAKFDQLVSGEKHAYARYKAAQRANYWLIVSTSVVGAIVSATALLPIPPFQLIGVMLEAKHITGLAGILLSTLVYVHQSLGIRARQAGYLEMHNRYKILRDKVALTVRSEEDFRALVKETNAIRTHWSVALSPPKIGSHK